MDALKQQLLRIQQQLAGLSASQKMLTGSLIVIMVMTLFSWARFAGSSEMATLIDAPVSAEDLGAIKSMLAGRGIKYEVQGDRILVPEEKRFEIIADLGYAQLLPRNETSGFEQIIAKLTPFDPASKTDRYMDHAREITLSRIVGSWPGVKSANVLMSTERKVGVTRNVQPSATVDVTTKAGVAADRRKLAEAAANLVSGAQGAIARDRVTVMIDGRNQKTQNGDDLLGDDNTYVERKAQNENYYIKKIQEAVSNVPGVFVTVSVDLNTKHTTSSEHTIDKTKVDMLLETSSKSTENAQAAAGGEPGVGANTGVTIEQASTSGAGQSSTGEESKSRFQVDHGFKDTQVIDRAGAAPAIGAALRIPDSYFIAAWKKRNGGISAAGAVPPRDPSDAELEVIVQRELPKLRSLVQAATAIKNVENITVETYIDLTEAPALGDSATAGLAALPTSFGFGAKEIAIAVLAVVSLFMMSMMVRKSAPAGSGQLAMAGMGSVPMTLDEADAVEARKSTLGSATDLAGEVGEAGMMLTGHELSGDEMEAKQMIEQVGTMVKENPDAAANLVKRWLNRD
ncbi:MAG TPA: flagellar M-ring protein FliF C-terminal domain-containing protein [Tepidisphaeraceae bacterium]|jgi:flagellar biosynthesis/type III secretory pathway M-ring protein FliF/YscJ